MNRYDELIVFILLKICRIIAKNSGNKENNITIYQIEQEIKKRVE